MISQCQTTQQSREGDIVGDGGEATTTFVSKNCSTSGWCYCSPSPSLSLPLLPYLLLLPLVFLLFPPLSFLPLLPSFLPLLHPCLPPVSLPLPHFSTSSLTSPPSSPTEHWRSEDRREEDRWAVITHEVKKKVKFELLMRLWLTMILYTVSDYQLFTSPHSTFPPSTPPPPTTSQSGSMSLSATVRERLRTKLLKAKVREGEREGGRKGEREREEED